MTINLIDIGRRNATIKMVMDQRRTTKIVWDFKTKFQFELFQNENNISYCRGKLENAPVLYSSKYSIIMSKDNHLTHPFVYKCHQSVMWTRETLNDLRKELWVPQDRNYIWKLLHKRVICKQFEGASYYYPLPPPIPYSRLSQAWA